MPTPEASPEPTPATQSSIDDPDDSDDGGAIPLGGGTTLPDGGAIPLGPGDALFLPNTGEQKYWLGIALLAGGAALMTGSALVRRKEDRK